LAGITNNYKIIIDGYEAKGYIEYHGLVEDVRPYLKIANATIHPTYYPEGMSNVLLESASTGRPIIASNRNGCKEIIEDGINGYLVEPKNLEDLLNKIEKFISLTHEEKKEMGIKGREKVLNEFDRSIVISAYLREIEKLSEN
jgi:galacturonosyltransferase